MKINLKHIVSNLTIWFIYASLKYIHSSFPLVIRVWNDKIKSLHKFVHIVSLISLVDFQCGPPFHQWQFSITIYHLLLPASPFLQGHGLCSLHLPHLLPVLQVLHRHGYCLQPHSTFDFFCKKAGWAELICITSRMVGRTSSGSVSGVK